MEELSRRRFLGAGVAGLGLVAAGCVDAARRTEWPLFRAGGDNQASTREHPGSDLGVGWSVEADDLFDTDGAAAVLSSPVGDTETAYLNGRFETDGGAITAAASIDVASGAVNWTRQLVSPSPIDPDELAQPPVLWEELLLVLGGDHAVVLDRADGSTAFDISLPSRPRTVAGGDRALVAVGGDPVAMLDIDEDQDVRWTIDTDDSITPVSPLTVLEDRIYLTLENRLLLLRRGDGEQLLEYPLSDAGGVTSTPPLVDGYHAHLRLRDETGTETLLTQYRDDRRENWRFEFGTTDTEVRSLLAYRGGRLYATHDGVLRSFHVGNGDLVFETPIGIEAPYPTVGGDDVYLLGRDELVIVDRHDGGDSNRITLPGPPGALPQEALPRSDALLITRGDRLIGLQPD